jgi:UDP-N-acetylglucosamine--N-acetylmuramyl-(pentapeptide) pyrophosphoryl-undecaprenol N-acetylglucosamine transferase
LARQVFEAFDGSFAPGVGAIAIGNPVRRAIFDCTQRPPDALLDSDRPIRLLVLGGSQGALVLNQTVPAALARIPESARPVVRHQAGRSLDQAQRGYTESGIAANCVRFIEDMAEAYAWADIVVARAGALTLSELAAAGVGAILVPYPHAIDDHQSRNAAHFVSAGAAVVVPQAELDAGRLATELNRLLSDRVKIVDMGVRCRALMHVDAAEQLADACVSLAGGQR